MFTVQNQRQKSIDINQKALENSWANDLMQGNQAWFDLHSVHRLHGTVGSEFIIWRYTNVGEPQVMQTLRINQITADDAFGLEMWVGRHFEDSSSFAVGHNPRQHPDFKLFLWIPAFADIRYAPKEFKDGGRAPRQLRIPFCAKVVSNSSIKLVHNGVYIHTVKEFKNLWPTVSI